MYLLTAANLRELIQHIELDLQPTQYKLCVPIINRLYRKMMVGIEFKPIQVVDKKICDGHHRYIASILAKCEIDKRPGIITSGMFAINWTAIIWDEADWDTPSKIEKLNEEDAEFNNIPLDNLNNLIN